MGNRLNSVNSQISSSSSIATLIVNGYIQQRVKLNEKTIIPQEVIKICIQFYDSIESIIYIRKDWKNHPQNLFISTLNQNYTNSLTKSKCILYTLDTDIYKNDIDIKMVQNEEWFIRCSSTYFVKNIDINLFPKSDKLAPFIGSQCIFKCGGDTTLAPGTSGSISIDNACSMIIWNDHCIKQEMDVLVWKLPNLPITAMGTRSSLIYSNKYGLICIGGGKVAGISIYKNAMNKVHRLTLTENNMNLSNWKWIKMSNIVKNRMECSTICIGDENEKIFIFGGRTAFYNSMFSNHTERSIEIFDLKQNKSKINCNMIYPRIRAGVCYDRFANRIYVGGGNRSGSCKEMEFYDIKKNKSYSLQETLMCHDYYPSIWIDKYNHNILYIASAHSGCIECADLRQISGKIKSVNKINWKSVASFNKLFGEKIGNTAGHRILK